MKSQMIRLQCREPPLQERMLRLLRREQLPLLGKRRLMRRKVVRL